MRRRSRYSLWRILFWGLVIVVAVAFCRKLYLIYELNGQIAEAEETRQELLQEKSDLEHRKEALSDPEVIERKARDDLGMVKPGEVPYVR